MARRKRKKNKLNTYKISIDGVPGFSWKVKASNRDEALVKSMENNRDSYIEALEKQQVISGNLHPTKDNPLKVSFIITEGR